MAVNNPSFDGVDGRTGASTNRTGVYLVGLGAVVLFLGLLSRVLNESVGHDENAYLGPASLFGDFALYREIAYMHLPNLTIFLSSFIGDDIGPYYLLGRLSILGCWLVLIGAFAALAWRWSQSLLITALSVLLLVVNPLFAEKKAFLISTQMFPITFAVIGLLFFVAALETVVRRWIYALLAGIALSIAVGFKANYVIAIPPIVIAACLAPQAASLGERFWRLVVPLGIGGLIGGAPTLYYMATDLSAFLFNTIDYFSGPHRAYWRDPIRIDEVTGHSLGGRLFVGFQLWGSGPTIAALVAAGFLAFAILERPDGWRRLLRLPVLVLTTTAALGVMVSFAVSPSFSQYFMPPVPFLILLIPALYADFAPEERRAARPVMLSVAAIAFIFGAPQLLKDLPKLASPNKWVTTQVHDTAQNLRTALAFAGPDARVGTLTPFYPIEAGLEIYPELAAGPFHYRVGQYLPAEDRATYNFTSTTDFVAVFDAAPPDGILIGHEGALDDPLEQYALSRGYRKLPEPIGSDRYGDSILYVRPGATSE